MRGTCVPMASPGTATTAPIIREKTKQNKRKFRADPPSPLHFTQENFKGVLTSGGGEIEDLNWNAIQKSMGALSIGGGAAADSGTRDPSSGCAGNTSEGASLVPEERLRWARAEQAREELMESVSIPDEDDEEDVDDEEEGCEEIVEAWDESTEGEIWDLLILHLDDFYNDAVKKIMTRGFSRDDAMRALFMHDGLHGGRIVLASFVEDALVYLADRGKTAAGQNEKSVDMKVLQKQTLYNMLYELRKKKPGLSRGEAMWRLLVFDLNIKHALSSKVASRNTHASLHSNSRPGSSLSLTTNTSAEFNPLPVPEAVLFPNVPPHPVPTEDSQSCSTSQLVGSSVSARSSCVEDVALNLNQPSNNISTTISAAGDTSTEITVNCALSMGQSESSPSSSSLPITEEADISKMAGDGLLIEDKKREEDEAGPQTGIGLETLKVQGGGGLVDDLPHSPARDNEGLFQEAVVSGISTDEMRDHLPSWVAESQRAGVWEEVTSHIDVLPQSCLTEPILVSNAEDQVGAGIHTGPAETDLSLSVCTPAESSHGSNAEEDDSEVFSGERRERPAQDESQAGIDDMEARKAEAPLTPQIQVEGFEKELKGMEKWAQQKVRQASSRLSKDLLELKSLRREHEEAIRVKKDQKALEDSAAKKMAEIDADLRRAKGQVDRANNTVKRLENENAEWRAEVEAAKLTAAESVATCQEVAKREKKGVKRAQTWEKQKAKLQEELAEERRKLTQLQNLLAQAKERQQQAEVRQRQEEKAKDEAVSRADNEKRAKEQAETGFKRREEASRRKAEQDKQRLRDDVERLTQELSSLRAAERTHFAASSWGSTVNMLGGTGGGVGLKEMNDRLLREVAELQGLSHRDVRRDRECVMCMCEEMSVVFLPCAHQVVCMKCNDLHEKQGMRDCPSCRAPIQQRIRVYGASF